MATVGFGATQKQQGLRLRLTLSELQKDGDKWKVTATATVVDHDGRLVPNVEVIFFTNGKRVEIETTDGEGEATADIVLKKGNHTVRVKIAGSTVSTQRRVTIKDLTPKQPGSLNATFNRGMGYTFHFTVLTDADSPAPLKGAQIRITGWEGGEVHPIETDKNGTAMWNTPLPQRSHSVTATVVGSSISRQLFLRKE